MAPLNDIINILLKFTKIIYPKIGLYKEKIIHKFCPVIIKTTGLR
nr:MAG TPA: hypothetical protein [Caudoviricetes sp.]